MFLWKQKGVQVKLKEATTIDNPKLKNLLKYDLEKQEDIINIFLKVKSNAEPYYNSILDVPYYKISKMRHIISKDTTITETIELVRILTGLSYKKITNLRTLKIITLHNFVKNGFEEIIRLESTLSRRHEAAEIKAGVEKLNKYSEMISIKSVMDFYNERWEQTEQRPYKECFAVWSMNTEKSDFDKNYFKIKTAKK